MYKILAILAIVAMFCTSTIGCIASEATEESSTPNNSIPPDFTIRLDPNTIQAAIDRCKDEEMWGISLVDVTLNYIKGVRVEAAIVLHNGNDAERLVTLEYAPNSSGAFNSRNSTFYLPAPRGAESWVTIDRSYIRMQPMETLPVKIWFNVPENANLPDKNWTFVISASGTVIDTFKQKLIEVKTSENSNYIVVHLPYPPLNGVKEDIKSIESTLPEDSPIATDYLSETQELVIEGLKESSNREIVITYEYGLPIQIAYNQVWYINMME